jgi:hypothetical protein
MSKLPQNISRSWQNLQIEFALFFVVGRVRVEEEAEVEVALVTAAPVQGRAKRVSRAGQFGDQHLVQKIS